jgi:hypothetical protein
MRHTRTKHALVYASMIASTAIASACSDSTTAPDVNAAVRAPRFALVPAPSQVVIAGTDHGAFVNAIVANNSGRATTEFWDDISADNTATNTTCNVGFYATGTMQPGCQNETPGSLANAGGYSTYWGDGPGNRDASSFMFNGAYSYHVTLLGAFAGLQSEIGYFTRNNLGQYTLIPVPTWGSKTLNTSVTVNTGGANWGFYIRNAFNPDLQGCNTTTTACSDATGGFTAQPFQQFALMLNSAQTKYLVGVEDNRLQLGSELDSDYNDYILSVEPVIPTYGTEGCSPGYWKNHNFPTGYSKSQLFSATSFGGSTFENAFPGMTLQQVLSQGGGGLAALGRQTVSAFFNAVTLNAFAQSPTSVIDSFNGVFPGTNAQYAPLQSLFEGLTDVNGRTCPNPTGR